MIVKFHIHNKHRTTTKIGKLAERQQSLETRLQCSYLFQNDLLGNNEKFDEEMMSTFFAAYD